eukprot:1158439-Pelagomonas_calceolata.AAC.5
MDILQTPCFWDCSAITHSYNRSALVRSDVLISGARMDEAVRIFIDLVLTCVEEVGAVPLYFVDGIAIMDPPSQIYEGSKQPFYQFFHMDDILERPEDFEKLAVRQVLEKSKQEIHTCPFHGSWDLLGKELACDQEGIIPADLRSTSIGFLSSSPSQCHIHMSVGGGVCGGKRAAIRRALCGLASQLWVSGRPEGWRIEKGVDWHLCCPEAGDHHCNAQGASRGVPVKKEQSNFKVQARRIQGGRQGPKQNFSQFPLHPDLRLAPFLC